MKVNMNISRACRYYLFRDKDIILNFIIFSFIIIGFNFLLYKGIFDDRGDFYIILMLYVLIIGFSQISSNAMVINLTVKDKLNKRIEFILASGIKVKDLIKSYAIEMWRISSIFPFILFYTTYLLYDFRADFKWLVGIFLSSIGMLYFEILFFNIVSLYQKNFKFFKNIVFFTTTIFIYLIGSFSKQILSFLEINNLNLIYLIIGLNIFLASIFAILSINGLRKMTNESVVNKEGRWS